MMCVLHHTTCRYTNFDFHCGECEHASLYTEVEVYYGNLDTKGEAQGIQIHISTENQGV